MAQRRNYLTSYRLEGECWVYLGTINNNGYGTILGKAAHRYFYEHTVGPIPEGLQIDHLCRNKACVRPEHLEPVTREENSKRRPDVMKSHCVHGHELTPENTRYRRVYGVDKRDCRECTRIRNAKRYLKTPKTGGIS